MSYALRWPPATVSTVPYPSLRQTPSTPAAAGPAAAGPALASTAPSASSPTRHPVVRTRTIAPSEDPSTAQDGTRPELTEHQTQVPTAPFGAPAARRSRRSAGRTTRP